MEARQFAHEASKFASQRLLEAGFPEPGSVSLHRPRATIVA
jgi:hypothetical protein